MDTTGHSQNPQVFGEMKEVNIHWSMRNSTSNFERRRRRYLWIQGKEANVVLEKVKSKVLALSRLQEVTGQRPQQGRAGCGPTGEGSGGAGSAAEGCGGRGQLRGTHQAQHALGLLHGPTAAQETHQRHEGASSDENIDSCGEQVGQRCQRGGPASSCNSSFLYKALCLPPLALLLSREKKNPLLPRASLPLL